jgi:hypothetical protein
VSPGTRTESGPRCANKPYGVKHDSPQLIPLTQRGDKGKDPKGIALEQRKEGKRSNYHKEIPQGNKKGNIQRRQRNTESQEEGTGKGDIPQRRSRGRIRGRPQGNAGKG